MPASVLTRYRSPWTRTVDAGTALHGLREWWRGPERLTRALRALRDLLGDAPASCAYAFTLFVTWWTLRGISDFAGHRLILSQSTNLHNMRREPVQVLVASAFWTEGGFPWGTIIGFLIVMAFAERWLGTLRWIFVFAVGHVGATLIVVTGISYAVHHHLIPLKVVLATDVGSSYGFSAVLAVLAFHLRGATRVAWMLALVVWYGLGVWRGHTFTDYGHLTAVLLGFVLGAASLLISLRLERWRDGQARATTTDPLATAPSLPAPDTSRPDPAGSR
ncbi:hypothetical protein KO481_31065 [Nocardia sp. NEAU-G5]|uniref:Rhomboid family intramembrane serine protease n=1 Tax=Nocardia albiluteola TaxID=2842303 RepID=A0ABS6B6Q6_9NOCA|nr:rhomboid-like protein [Nocardia albiluteola]MBU3065949.1 hypothetical protein [Nocardia albiluteola]